MAQADLRSKPDLAPTRANPNVSTCTATTQERASVRCRTATDAARISMTEQQASSTPAQPTQPATPAQPTPSSQSDRSRLAGTGTATAETPVRGREPFVSVLDDAFRSADASGTARVLVLRASPGMGKTRLLREGLHYADRLRWRTLTITPDVDSENLPLGALTDAALNAHPPFVTIADLAPILSGRDPQYWVTRVLVEALDTAASTGGGVLVAVDDLQWLDAGSLSALAALIRGVADLPVVWLLASRPGVTRVEHARLISLADEQDSVIDLPPLPEDAVRAIAVDLVGREPGPQLEQALQHTNHVPLLIVEMLRGLRDEHLLTETGTVVDVASSTIPARYGASARDRIAQLSPAARRVAQAGSLFGRRFNLSAALEALPVADDELPNALDELLRDEVCVEDGAVLAFTHDTLREAAEASIPRALLKRSLHTVVRIRLRAGEPVSAVANSVVESATPGDDDSIMLLRDAAREMALTDAAGAAALAARAVELADGASRFQSVLLELIPMLWMGGRGTLAKELVDDLAPSLPAEERAKTLLTLARLMTESSFNDSIAICNRALALPGTSDAVRVQLLAIKALNSANVGDSDGLTESIAEARAIGRVDRDWAALATIDACESVALFHQMHFDDAEHLIRTALTAIRNGGDDANQWLPEGLWLSFVLNSRGRPDLALPLADEGLADAQRARNAPAIAFWMMARSRYLFDLGRLEDAREQADTVLRLAAELGLGDFANATAGIVVFRTALQTGDNASLEQLRPAMEQMANGTALTRAGNWALALAAIDIDEPRRAFELASHALDSLELPVASMNTPPDFVDDLTLAAICMLAGEEEAGQKVLRVATERARMNPDDVFSEGIRAAVEGVITLNAAALRHAVEVLRTVPRPLALARSLEMLERVSTDPAEQIAALEEAVTIHETAGASRGANRVLIRLRALGVRRRPKSDDDGSGLSARERLVVQQLITGATTKQIATALLLSPHTVITHVRHASAKYGVSSRKELVAEFLRRNGGANAA